MTQLDTWRTAAWMTCLLPFGLMFGVPALVMLRKKGIAIQRGEFWAVGRSLKVARVLVVGGAVCAAVVMVWVLAQVAAQMNAVTLDMAPAVGGR